MIVTGRSIRNLARHFAFVPRGAQIIVGIARARVSAAKLAEIGFPANVDVNAAILPAGSFGRVSHFNAHGREEIHTDRPKETVARWVYTSWEDWHGQRHSGYVSRSYERYPRTFIPPPAVEISILAMVTGEELLTTPVIGYEGANEAAILHRVNLLLEMFGECEVFTANLERIIQAPVHRLNWRLLPIGARPFAQLRQEIEPLVRRAPQEERPVIFQRLETINGRGPEFVAIGEGGFSGYVVFGFPGRHLFLFESISFGNATYVFGKDWQYLSRLTKAEILDQNLAIERVIHRDAWRHRILQLLP